MGRISLTGILTFAVAGCSFLEPSSEAEKWVIQEVESLSAIEARFDAMRRMAFKSGSVMSNLAIQADTEAVNRSAAFFELNAAQLELSVVNSQWYPQMRPIASVSTSGTKSLGISVEQKIWDFGRANAEHGVAKSAVKMAEINFWIERNEAVYDTLDAWLDAQKSLIRISELKSLKSELEEFHAAISDRTTGGISGRREMIEIDVAVREMVRETLDEQLLLTVAQTKLNKAIDKDAAPYLTAEVNDLSGCIDIEEDEESPEHALARLKVVKAEFERRTLSTMRFPALVGGVNIPAEGRPSVTVRLDTRNFLGSGMKARMAAANQTTSAILRDYHRIKRAVHLDLAGLRAELNSQLKSLANLKKLINSAEENIEIFDELFASGQVRIIEGIQLVKEASETRRDYLDRKVDSARTCIRIARIRGALVKFRDKSG